MGLNFCFHLSEYFLNGVECILFRGGDIRFRTKVKMSIPQMFPGNLSYFATTEFIHELLFMFTKATELEFGLDIVNGLFPKIGQHISKLINSLKNEHFHIVNGHYLSHKSIGDSFQLYYQASPMFLSTRARFVPTQECRSLAVFVETCVLGSLALGASDGRSAIVIF